MCKEPRCQICNIITTDSEINIFYPGNYNCDSSNIVYLLMCNKCNYINYVGKILGNLGGTILPKNEQPQKNICDNHKGLPVAVHYHQSDHSI